MSPSARAVLLAVCAGNMAAMMSLLGLLIVFNGQVGPGTIIGPITTWTMTVYIVTLAYSSRRS